MDTPETLAADMLKAAAEAAVATRTITQVGAFNIKRDARANVSSRRRSTTRTRPLRSPTTPASARRRSTPRSATTRTASRAGLGNLLEYGGGGDHSPPHRDLGRALDAEEPRFTAALEALVEKLL
jgi:hypothetical protein